MATLVRKKAKPKQRTHQELTDHPLVASGAPYRGNGGTSSNMQEGGIAHETSPIKIHVSPDDLLLMENFNGQSPVTPSAPEIDILRDSKHNEQLDHWEAIMMGSPMTPLMSMDPNHMRQPDEFSLTGENPPSSSETATAPVQLNGQSPDSSPSFLETQVPPVERKYTLPPASVTISSVADLLAPSKSSRLHLTAPVYPVLAQLKPIVLPQSHRVVAPQPYMERPLLPLQEVPRVPLRRFEHYDDHVHLRDLSLRHYEERSRAIETAPDDFYRLVEAYLHFDHALRQAHVQLLQRIADVDERRANVWTIDFESASTSALCGDLKTIDESVEYQTASLNPQLQANLADALGQLRQLRTAEASLHLFDRALGFLRVELAVDVVVEGGDMGSIQTAMDTLFFFEKHLTTPRFMGTVPSSVRRGQLVLDKQAKGLVCHACGHVTAISSSAVRVVSCGRCDALGFVPHTTIAVSSKEFTAAIAQVRRSIQHWLTRCMAKLHQLSSTPHDENVAKHGENVAKHGKNVAQHGKNVAQHGKDEAVMPWLIAHLLHLPGLALERQWAVGFVHFAPPSAWTVATLDHFLAMMHLLFHPAVLPMQYAAAADDDVGVGGETSPPPDEWLLMELPSHGELSLLDADYVLLWRQFPLDTALSHCMTLAPHDAYSRLLYLVNECTVVFEKFADYDQLVTSVSDALGKILVTASQTSHGSLFDQLFQIGLFGVVMARSPKVYTSLPSWAYHALSPSGQWDALSAFFFQPSIPSSALKAYIPFTCFLNDHPSLRLRFYHEVSRNQALLAALGVLASHTPWSELVQTIVHELFLCYMATPDTLLDAHVRTLSGVCTAHPCALSQLLTLVCHHDTGMAVLPQLPIRLWHPTEADLGVFQAWLMLDHVHDPKSQLVRTLLDRMNWGYLDDQSQLALHPTVHRHVALLLVDATVHHSTNVTWSSRLVAFDFAQWSWQLVLKLHFYSPRTYEPYLTLVRLDSDLTRHAMILRRYAKSLPKSHVVLGKAEHAMDSHSCISYVEPGTSTTSTTSTSTTLVHPEEEEDGVVPLAEMQPIVLYVVCQVTDHLYSTCIDKFAPLLSLVLDHNRPVAVLQVLENILPTLSQTPLNHTDVHTFVKNYLDNNADWRSIVRVLAKNWYFLPDLAKSTLVDQLLANDDTGGISQILPVIVSTLEQSVCVHPALLPALLGQLPSPSWMQSAMSTLIGFKSAVLQQPRTAFVNEVVQVIRRQYLHTNLHSNVLLVWLVVVMGVPNWSDAPVYRQLVDSVIECALVHRPDTAMVELEAPFRLYLDHMCAVFPTSSLSFVPTCVPPSTSSYYMSSVVFRGHPPNVELYLGFLSLLVEIRKEKELFKALGHIVLKSKLKVKSLDTLRAKGRLATELYVFGIDTSQPTLYGHLDLQFHSWHTLKLFKVASFVLQHRESSHPVDLLLWQLLFALYFASVGSDCFGFLMLELHPHTRKALQTKCRRLSNVYSAQIGNRSKADELARTYAAMETWLEHPDVSTWLHQIDHLPRHYNTAQLKQVLGLSHALLHTADTIDMTSTTIWEDIAPFLWLPLCDFAYTTPATAAPLSSSDPPPPTPPPPSLCPSPLPFHAPKYVRFSPVVSIDTMQSVELRTEPFHDRATVYADAVATLATLETEFLDHLNGLYQPKHRVVHTSRPCDGTSHEPCKRPAALHLEYTEWTVDADRVERIDQFHIQSAKLDLWTTDIPTVPSVGMMVDRSTSLGLTPLDVQVCYQILVIDQMVALLTQSPDQFQSMGVQWFHKLLHLDTKATRGFPPFQEVLWRSIKRLGATFVNADETTGLLRFMLQDCARVCLLADCFFPNQTPTRFVEYFASIMYQSEHLESADRLELLSRFDIALWLDHDPILFDRDTLVSIVLAELVLGNAKLDILRMHAKMIHVLASRYLDDHVDKIVCALLGVYDVHYASDLHAMRSYFEVPTTPPSSKALDVSMWHALLNIPPSCWSRCKVVPQLVDRVAQFVLHARTKASQAKQVKDISALLITSSAAYPIVTWHSDQAILQPLCDLMLLWIKASPPDTLWPIATKLFEAFLTVLYTPGPTPDATTIVEPWPPTEESADQVLCHALQATFTLYLDLPPDVDASARLDNIWQFYRRVLLPHASDALAGSYNAVLSRLPWSLWGISEDTLNEMKEGVVPSVQTTTATKSANFKYQSPLRPNVLLLVQTILAQVPWSRIAAHLADQPPHVMSSFYIKYHVLLCHVLLLVDTPSSSPPQKSYPLPRPVKVAEVEAICNGVSALLLHPSVLCVPPRTDASPRFYATFGLLLSLCGLQLTNGTASGDELKKAAAVLHCLSVFLHPLSPDWKQNFPAFESTMLGLVQAALRSVLDLVMLLHAQVDTLDRTFKADHVTALYCDIFKLCNLPFISQASLVVDSTLSTSTSSSTSWMELEAKVSVAIPPSSQECTMLSLDKCMPWSVVGWQLLWQFAGISKSLPAICVSVASVSVLSQLTERNLSCWNMSTWPQLKLPELSQDELVITSVKHQCWLTLLAFAKQQRFDADIQRQLHFSMRMNEWVEEIAAAAAISDQAKLVGVILALLARLLAMPGVAVTFKRDMVARMSKACWSMGDARQLSNGLDAVQRAMGFNFMNSFGKLKHSAELHVAMLALSLFMRVNSRKSAVLRLDYGAPLDVSKKTLKLIKTMEGMPERKEVVQWSIAFCQDPKRCLRDLDEFAKVLITELYPAHVWMLPLVKD